MIYYSPYKQIIRAFLRSVRVFISSLFTKRLLFMIIVALVIILLHMNVQADSIEYDDGYAYRVVNERIDENTGHHYYDYRIYQSTGMFEGTIRVDAWFYNNCNNFFLYLMRDGRARIVVSKNNQNNFYINGRSDDFNTSSTPHRWSFSENGTVFDYYQFYSYNSSTPSWHLDYEHSGDGGAWAVDLVPEPNAILYRHNMYINYHVVGGSAYQSFTSDLLQVKPRLKSTSLRLTEQGLRFYLGDFHDLSILNDSFNREYTLTKISCSIKDINTNTDFISDNNILTYNNVEQDSNGNYFIDLLFSDYLIDLNNQSGDYIISFTPYVNIFEHILDYDTYNKFDTNSLFSITDYYRYTYSANDNSIVIASVDENGNSKNDQSQIIGNNTNENTNSNNNNSEAINELNNTINNQTQQQHQDAQATQTTIEESTNAILSTEADDITMDDFGVQSPTIENEPDLSNVFNMLYNSFMQVYEDDIYRISFGLPFVDKTFNFDIPADSLRSKLPNELVVLIGVFWWVVLGGFVITFIVKIIHQIVTYSNGSVDGKSSGGFLSELTMTPTEFVLFNILH